MKSDSVLSDQEHLFTIFIVLPRRLWKWTKPCTPQNREPRGHDCDLVEHMLYNLE